jgi:2-C-methyl-D-erythritol 4-phosphate cytidylyltransferase
LTDNAHQQPQGRSRPDVGVIIVAAGSGSRTGSSELKQFRWVAGKPMLLHSLQTFQDRPDVSLVVCVLPRSHAGDPPPWIFQSDHDRLAITVGGRTRGESVIAGLQELGDECRVVLVHDAARPLVPPDVIDRVVTAARAGTGAVAALPVTDTIKEVDDEGRIVRTVERTRLWRAQTPQGFPREMIDRAYLEARRERVELTDDAAVCERMGFPVVVVRGSERSLKVTEEPDFARAEAIAGLDR